MVPRKTLLFITTCLTALCGLGIAHAQPAFPNAPVTMVVPYPAGGGTDFFARTVAVKMGDKLGQPVVVENKPGAATAIGAADVARAKPDGYRILLGDTATYAANSSIYKKLQYDALKDFAPLTLTGRFTLVLLVNPLVLPVSSVAELVAAAKKAPGTINYGTPGAGSPFHLATVMFERMAGISVTHVPYKGAAPAITDLLGGHIPMAALSIASGMPHIQGGKVRGLAVTSAARSPALPDVPTVAESGFPGFEANGWLGILAPNGTPPDVIAKLNGEIAKVMQSSELKKQLLAQGVEARVSTPEQFGAFIKSESAKWGKIIADAGIKE
jgi:tripartite-type tricarboxylate transporter receptor subunit TctC